jgi:hypothetical protein
MYAFAAPSQEDALAWLEALKEAIREHWQQRQMRTTSTELDAESPASPPKARQLSPPPSPPLLRGETADLVELNDVWRELMAHKETSLRSAVEALQCAESAGEEMRVRAENAALRCEEQRAILRSMLMRREAAVAHFKALSRGALERLFEKEEAFADAQLEITALRAALSSKKSRRRSAAARHEKPFGI